MFTIKITPNDQGNPPGKLADVELHFVDVPCPECEGSGAVIVADSGPLAGAAGICAECDGQRVQVGSNPLAGLKLIGFSIWDRRGGSGRNVTFPARQYAINGERRSFAFVSLAEGIDATTPAGRLQMHILGSIAEFERERIRERVVAGLRRARSQGKRLGRPQVVIPVEQVRRLEGLTAEVAAVRLGVSRSTVKRWRRQVAEPRAQQSK